TTHLRQCPGVSVAGILRIPSLGGGTTSWGKASSRERARLDALNVAPFQSAGSAPSRCSLSFRNAIPGGFVMRSLALLLAVALPLNAQTPKPAANTGPLLTGLDAAAPHYATVAKQIWSFAEVGYMEQKSSALLQSELKGAGFNVKAGV